MKKSLSFVTAIFILTLTLPAIPAAVCGKFGNSSEATQKIKTDTNETSKTENTTASKGTYKVLDISTGEVLEVDKLDYIIGAVCAEMPATFEPEALKAQAVAAHTYAERQALKEKASPTPELCGADFSNDTTKYQGYFTLNQTKQYYGDNFELYYSKISDAVKDVCNYIVTYNEEPIVSAFHSMSSGKTESAENAWGSPVDYLVSVDSSFDTTAPKYFEETAFSPDILKEKLNAAFPNIQLGDDFTKWLEISEISEAGTVLSVKAGNLELSGDDLRTALSLRSASFEISFTASEIIFTTKGYGHGVGMSQYGANSMALQGKSWQDIINHYYRNCQITVVP